MFGVGVTAPPLLVTVFVEPLVVVPFVAPPIGVQFAAAPPPLLEPLVSELCWF
jgi:hypothetical protein